MKKFRLEMDFVELFPEAKIGIVLCRGINNTVLDVATYQQMILTAELEAKAHLKHEEFSSNTVIKVWRDAFQKFKTKKGVRSSIEALLKRVQNGNPIGSINPLVDIYNAISLKYGLPCGGEDIATFVGDVRLTLANGDEDFIPLGTTENSPPYLGEVVYKDDQGAICRCWNWRESFRTMLTEQTQDAFMCLELVDPSREDAFIKALNELASNIFERLGGTTQILILDANNREIIIEY